MFDHWPIRRLVAAALVASFSLVLPLAGIVYFRLYQIEAATAAGAGVADLAVRDVTAYLAVWLLVAVGLAVWVDRLVDRPARRLARVTERIAEGDLDAEVPRFAGAAMARLAEGVRRAVTRAQEFDDLKDDKILELRNLVRRLVSEVPAPVMIVGADRVDYLNAAAAAAIGGAVEDLEGRPFDQIPGGAAIHSTAEALRKRGDGRGDAVVETDPDSPQEHVANCALVRDRHGEPTRVIMVLKNQEGAWWKRLFERAP